MKKKWINGKPNICTFSSVLRFVKWLKFMQFSHKSTKHKWIIIEISSILHQTISFTLHIYGLIVFAMPQTLIWSERFSDDFNLFCAFNLAWSFSYTAKSYVKYVEYLHIALCGYGPTTAFLFNIRNESIIIKEDFV